MFFRKKKTAAPDTRDAARTLPGESDAGAKAGPSTTAFLTGNDNLDRRAVEMLLSAIARVSESRDLESLLVFIVDTSIEITQAERGFLILLDEKGDLIVRVSRQRGKQPVTGEVRFSTSVVKKVLSDTKLEPVRATVSSDSEALELGTSVFDLKLRAVMCVPLVTSEDESAVERGALYVDSKAATREFSQKDLALFHALSQHIRIALTNARLHMASLEKARLEQSLQMATDIQRDLMPELPNDVPGYDIHGWYLPAERTTGDFYDFVRMKAGRLGVFLGDVTGHGIGPALIMASAKASLRSYMRVLDDPAGVVGMLNQDLGPRMDDGRFLTLFLAILAQDGTLQVLNAGQTPPLLWRAKTRTIERIPGHGPALGMMDDFEYVEGPRHRLEPGDVLVAFTDGLVEARSTKNPDKLFGEEGMRAVLQACALECRGARDTTEAVVRAVLEFAGGKPEDDMTLVVVRRADE
jgi:serine phosphatase RsbU (regulator of sigma subunit)